jgi:hypothetical protein
VGGKGPEGSGVMIVLEGNCSLICSDDLARASGPDSLTSGTGSIVLV